MRACDKGYDPAAMLAVHETVHQRLARQGVRSIQFGHHDYAGSAYNRIASRRRRDGGPQHAGRRRWCS